MSQTANLLSRVSLSGLVAVGGATNASGHSPLLCEAYFGAFGTPVQDGLLAVNEYKRCSGPITQMVGTQPYDLEVCATNNTSNNYYAVSISDLTDDEGDSVFILFDDEHDGKVAQTNQGQCLVGEPVEDIIGFISKPKTPADPHGGFFLDGFYCEVHPIVHIGLADQQSIDGFGLHGGRWANL